MLKKLKKKKAIGCFCIFFKGITDEFQLFFLYLYAKLLQKSCIIFFFLHFSIFFQFWKGSKKNYKRNFLKFFQKKKSYFFFQNNSAAAEIQKESKPSIIFIIIVQIPFTLFCYHFCQFFSLWTIAKGTKWKVKPKKCSIF